MTDFASLLEFSHSHCVAICSALVPLNLIATSLTLGLVGLNQSGGRILVAAGLASLASFVMVLHVMTWFVIGVVMIPTYVLLLLGSVCLGINLWAVLHPRSQRQVLAHLGQWLLSLRLKPILKN